MIRLSIRRKIMGIAVALIVLMTITAILSIVWVIEVGHRLQELTDSYIPAYGDLARANIRSLERALALRRMVIEKLQSPSSGDKLAAIRNVFDAKGVEVEREAQAARALIHDLVEKGATLGDETALVRLETRIDSAMADTRRELNAEIERLLATLDTGNAEAIAESLARVDALRDDLNRKLDSIRADMLAIVKADAATTVHKQRQAMLIAAILTALAAAVGLVFAALVSSGMARPVRRLLEGARAVEAGRLDETLDVTSQDEIGHLTTAFNRMVEQLRHKERMRETFGKYVDPRIVEGLIDRPMLAVDGQRRVMTVLFCDVKGFTGASEGMTPQGLVKVMNRYFSAMRADPRSWRSDRQIYRRRHHGLLGTAIHRGRGSGRARLPRRGRHAGARRAVAGRISRAPRPAQLADYVRHTHRHCHRRGARRQHRLRADDELHSHG
jgi:HAMP domain-containing protein